MNAFQKTMAELAKKPKTARLASSVLKSFKTASMGEDIAKHLIGGAALGTGGYLASRALDRFGTSPDRLSSERKEYGKLVGEHRFHQSSVAKLKPIHNEILNSLEKDPEFAQAPAGTVSATYGTMRRFAPYLAADPNVARSFVRTHAIHGELPSYATLKTLADAEQSVSRAGVMEI